MMQFSKLPFVAALTIYISAATIFIPRIYAQNIVSVNNVTGTAVATVPICNVSVGDLSAPVALTYSASGLKVEDYDNSFGMGWRLLAGASIRREVRGFPDDVEYQSDPSYSIIKGWLRSGNNAPQSVQSFSPANTTPPNCSGEITDANAIASNYSYTFDTEPDYFTISAPGLSCSFVFDATSTHVIKTIPYKDYQISYSTDTYGRIISFTVTNDNGVKYYFDQANMVEQSVDIFNPGTTVAIDPNNLEVFKRDFLMYRNKANVPGYPLGYPVKYNDNWALSKMEDTKGNRISFTYENFTVPNPEIYKRYSQKKVEILVPDGSSNISKKLLYIINTVRVDLHLLSISTYAPGFEAGTTQTVCQFDWNGNDEGTVDKTKLMKITLPTQNQTYELVYTNKFRGNSSVWSAWGRYFLKGLKTYKSNTNCTNVFSQYDFTYYGVDYQSGSCYCVPPKPDGTGTMDTIVNIQDYWGFYNGSIINGDLTPQIYAYPDNPTIELFKINTASSGTVSTIPSNSTRSVNTQFTLENVPQAGNGTLKKIYYPTGANTTLEYELNDYYDKDVTGNVPGGGIRIKRITNNDGLNNTDVTEYNYNDPSNTSATTGRAVSVPKFTINFLSNTSFSTSTAKVINTTYRTTYDLNTESEAILYGKVTVKKTSANGGIGKTVFEYNTTGTYGSTPLTDWQETTDYISRTNLSSPTPCNAITPTYINNRVLQYPFAPHANFDFERGLPTKTTVYNEAGQVVATEEYTYARSHSTVYKIAGLRLDDIGNTATAYGKYALNSVVDNFLVTKNFQTL
ncbi:MAG: hypothetical protein JST86_00175 [Bacteroidetes bacterium]|nr:hypothetical protein [Bacteroidota bacterium]